MFDAELPSVSKTTTPKARVQHRCCECGGIIQPGEQYEYIKGIWEGKACSFKTCMECVAIRHEFSDLSSREWPAFGDLYEHITEGYCPALVVRFDENRERRKAE